MKIELTGLLIRGSLVRVQEGEQERHQAIHESGWLFSWENLGGEVYPAMGGKSKGARK